MPAGHECTLRNHESRENDFLGGENRALLKFSGFEELSHTILTGFICVSVYLCTGYLLSKTSSTMH